MFDDQKEIDCTVTQSEGEESDVEFVMVIAKGHDYPEDVSSSNKSKINTFTQLANFLYYLSVGTSIIL